VKPRTNEKHTFFTLEIQRTPIYVIIFAEGALMDDDNAQIKAYLYDASGSDERIDLKEIDLSSLPASARITPESPAIREPPLSAAQSSAEPTSS